MNYDRLHWGCERKLVECVCVCVYVHTGGGGENVYGKELFAKMYCK